MDSSRSGITAIEQQVHKALMDMRHATSAEQARYIAVWKHLLASAQICSGIIEAES